MIEAASRVALAAERELEALVAVSSPSGDVNGAEECVALATAFLPTEAEVERIDCSTPNHARDLVGRLRGGGTRRVVLLGHLDTVVHHDAHRPLARDGDRLTGSGAVDMKGGVALALAVMRELAERPELYAEAVVLLVNDEEWRTAPFVHGPRFAGFDACLCFEAGQRAAGGADAVIVKRKAAATAARRTRAPPRSSGEARCSRSPPWRRWWPAVATRPAPTASPPFRPSSDPGTPSMWSPRGASSSATCAPTGSRHSTLSWQRCPASTTR